MRGARRPFRQGHHPTRGGLRSASGPTGDHVMVYYAGTSSRQPCTRASCAEPADGQKQRMQMGKTTHASGQSNVCWPERASERPERRHARHARECQPAEPHDLAGLRSQVWRHAKECQPAEPHVLRTYGRKFGAMLRSASLRSHTTLRTCGRKFGAMLSSASRRSHTTLSLQGSLRAGLPSAAGGK